MEQLELYCTACHWSLVCNQRQMLLRLQEIGFLRRDKEPAPEIIVELFRQNAGLFSCQDCGLTGLKVDLPREDEEDWGGARVCETCRKVIPAERLEVFPETKICVACQENSENPEQNQIPDFCPRCGNIMSVSTGTKSGLTQYSLRCPTCR